METNTLIEKLTSADFLGGALITLIITKVIDYFLQKRSFKHEFQRLFYTKKLEATEKCINLFVPLMAYYSAILMSIKLFISNGDKSYISEILEKVLKKLESLWNTMAEQASLIDFYYNIKPNAKYPVDNISKMMSYFSEISKYNNADELNDKSKEEVKQILEELNECLIIEIGRCNYYLKVIREEFRKYDM